MVSSLDSSDAAQRGGDAQLVDLAVLAEVETTCLRGLARAGEALLGDDGSDAADGIGTTGVAELVDACRTALGPLGAVLPETGPAGLLCAVLDGRPVDARRAREAITTLRDLSGQREPWRPLEASGPALVDGLWRRALTTALDDVFDTLASAAAEARVALDTAGPEDARRRLADKVAPARAQVERVAVLAGRLAKTPPDVATAAHARVAVSAPAGPAPSASAAAAPVAAQVAATSALDLVPPPALDLVPPPAPATSPAAVVVAAAPRGNAHSIASTASVAPPGVRRVVLPPPAPARRRRRERRLPLLVFVAGALAAAGWILWQVLHVWPTAVG